MLSGLLSFLMSSTRRDDSIDERLDGSTRRPTGVSSAAAARRARSRFHDIEALKNDHWHERALRSTESWYA